MKKFVLLLSSASLIICLTGCNAIGQSESIADQSYANQQEPHQELHEEYTASRPLTEDRIIADLNASDKFWLYISPNQTENVAQSYTLKNVDIISQETTEGGEEVFITAHAESPFASYMGNFILKYNGDKKNGYVLNSVYQDYSGNYKITAPPTEEIATEWYARPSFALPSPVVFQKGELLSASIQEIEGRNYLCEIQYNYSCPLDAHCSVNETLCCYCRFENGIWIVTNELSREPETIYIYDLPPVSSQEIASAVSSAVPQYIGTYDATSGTVTIDENNAFLTYVSGCTITSTYFDTSQFSLDLKMRCQEGGDYVWYAETVSANGYLSFKTTDEITLFDLINERNISVKMSSLTYDAETNQYIAAVTTTDAAPPWGRIPAGTAVDRSMELGIMAGPGIRNAAYYLRDNDYYIYFDADMTPLNFTYEN